MLDSTQPVIFQYINNYLDVDILSWLCNSVLSCWEVAKCQLSYAVAICLYKLSLWLFLSHTI